MIQLSRLDASPTPIVTTNTNIIKHPAATIISNEQSEQEQQCLDRVQRPFQESETKIADPQPEHQSCTEPLSRSDPAAFERSLWWLFLRVGLFLAFVVVITAIVLFIGVQIATNRCPGKHVRIPMFNTLVELGLTLGQNLYN